MPGNQRDVEEDLLDLYENAPCGYLSTTMNGVILRANATFLEWSGYAAEDLVGPKTFSDLLTAGGRIYHETHYAPLLGMQGWAREIAVDIVAADGRRLPALVNAVVRGDADGERVVRIAVFPASDRREYERELMRARRRAEESEARARELAETLQASLIPPRPPAIPGLDVGAAFRPAGTGDEVGGDFYDIFELAEGNWAVAIGDVRGKGAQAASVTALARYTIRAAAAHVSEPRSVLASLNEAMLGHDVDTFCTAAFACITERGSAGATITLAAGGHPLPMHLTPGGDVTPVGRPGTLMGVLEEPELYDSTLVLSPGESLIFFTDGVTEGRRDGRLVGEAGLVDILQETGASGASAMAERVVDDVVRFQHGSPRDDIAVVVLKVPR